MSILLFTTKGEIMALKSKSNIPEESIEQVSEQVQISFDDIEFEADYVDEDQETKKFYTISGKESWYEPTWEKYGIHDLEVGDTFEGRPEINIFENDEKSYNALRLRVMDDGEILDLYVNYPKKDFPFVRNINKKFDFYRKCFDFIYGVLKWEDEHNVIDSQGEEVNRFGKINIEMLAKYVDQHNRIGVKITEGNIDSEYNSFIIYKLE
jgi:hypothetical protein